MIGLIYKDLMVMKKTLFLYSLMGLFYGYLSIAENMPGMMFAIVLLIATMVPISALAYDERCKWDKYVNTLPLSRREVVLAKYLLSLLLTVVSAVVVFAVYLLGSNMPLSENIATTIVISLMSMAYSALLLPVMIKFGSEKGRSIMLLILFVPVILTAVLAKLKIFNAAVIGSFLESNSHLLPYITLIAVAVLYAVSIAISVRIYEKKDL